MKTQRHSHAAKSHSFLAASSQTVLAFPWPTLASFPGPPRAPQPGILLALTALRAVFWALLHWHTHTHTCWQILCTWRSVTQRNHVRSIYLPYSWLLENKSIPGSQRILLRWFCSSESPVKKKLRAELGHSQIYHVLLVTLEFAEFIPQKAVPDSPLSPPFCSTAMGSRR